MSVTVKIFNAVEATIGGELKSIGSRANPQEVTIDGEAYDVSVAITNSSGTNYVRQVIWQSGIGGLDDFDVMVVETDADISVELTIDRAGSPTYSLLGVEAGNLMVFTTDDILATIAADGSADSMDQIDQVAIKNNVNGSSADVTANVRVLLMT